MAHTLIPIPGGTTIYEEAPVVQITGGGNSDLRLSITYNAAAETDDNLSLSGEIVFSGVLEYRWQVDFVEYQDFPELQEDYEFGLIEIHNSPFIENMAQKGVKAQFHEHRFAEGFKDSEVRHFRIAFDDYGHFDVISLEVTVREINERQ